jgi:acetyl esterase/lipase
MRKIILTILFLSFTLTNLLKSQPVIVKIWPQGVPGSIQSTLYVQTIEHPWGRDCIAKISNPEMLVYKAPKKKSTGTAILVCPGGGYQNISIVNEGYDIVKWLNEIGITAVILKYRLPSDEIMKNKTIGPLQDAQEAMRIIRRNAKEWSIDPSKIGVMGFSAGGHLASTLSTHFNDSVYSTDSFSARPDFSILIYPVISMDEKITHIGSRNNLLGEHPDSILVNKFSNELRVTAETPPTFLVHSSDDGAVSVENSLMYFAALKKKNIPIEMHIYRTGGHGYGLGDGKNTESLWPSTCVAWLKSNGWVK